MLKKLRIRLIVTYLFITGTLLILMTHFTSSYFHHYMDTQIPIRLESLQKTLTTYIETNPYIDTQWLAQLESNNRVIIHILDNGKSLFFKGGWSPITSREQLISAAYSQVHTTSPSSYFEIIGENKDRYIATHTFIPTHSSNLSILLIQDTLAETLQLKQLRSTLLTVVIIILFVLFILSWFLSGLSITPMEINHQKHTNFIASASHELRSPLSVIQTSADAIVASSSEDSHFLSLIQKECTHMSQLISDLLLLASSDMKSLKCHFVPCDIQTLLISTVESMESQAHANHQTLMLKLCEEDIPLLSLDESKIKQLLTILINNAIAHAGSHTQITVDAHYNSRMLKLVVEDDGVGIAPNHHAHLFDRFYQADQCHHSKEHYGLGLSIAKEIVTLHRGDIKLFSHEGEGTTFTITLPLQRL